MSEFQLKYFSIIGFQNRSDVSIPFEGPTKILIGENGIGKTQILNILYYCLSRKFDKLVNYTFSKIIIGFADEEIEIQKSHVESSVLGNESPLIQRISSRMGFNEFALLRNKIAHEGMTWGEFRRSNFAHDLITIAPLDIIFDVIKSSLRKDKYPDLFSSELSAIKEKISEKISPNQILYFPTYRRIEEELKNLGYNEEELRLKTDDNKLIHFGMDDVQRRFEIITGNIYKISKEGFAKLSSEILSQLVRGNPVIDEYSIDSIDENDIQIILERIGKQLSNEDKEKIRQTITNKELKGKNNLLLYFLQKLVEIYNQQREFDATIKEFVRVCNNYLVNKKVIYDESAMSIYIQLDDSDKKLLLSKLSSGEKQIISILSKIYLTTKDYKFIVLFDEPELSLSLFWQRNLLPDIVNSGKCAFLLAVTHSPFIFENDLDQFAIGTGRYIKPYTDM